MTAPPDPYAALTAAARHALRQLEVAVKVGGADPRTHIGCCDLRAALNACEAAPPPPPPCPNCARLLGGLAVLTEEADLAARRAGQLGEEDRAQDVARRALRALARGLHVLLTEAPGP